MGFTNQEAESQTSLIFSQFKPSHDPNVSNAIPRLELTNLELQQGIGANFTFAYFPPSFPLGPVHPPMDHFITWFPLFTDDRVYKGRRLGKFVADFLDKNLFGNGIPCLSGPSNRKTIVGFFHPRLTNLDKLKSFVFPLDSLSLDDSNSNGYSEVDDTFGPKITFSEVFARTQCFFSFTIPLHLLFTEIYGYYGDILGSSAFIGSNGTPWMPLTPSGLSGVNLLEVTKSPNIDLMRIKFPNKLQNLWHFSPQSRRDLIIEFYELNHIKLVHPELPLSPTYSFYMFNSILDLPTLNSHVLCIWTLFESGSTSSIQYYPNLINSSLCLPDVEKIPSNPWGGTTNQGNSPIYNSFSTYTFHQNPPETTFPSAKPQCLRLNPLVAPENMDFTAQSTWNCRFSYDLSVLSKTSNTPINFSLHNVNNIPAHADPISFSTVSNSKTPRLAGALKLPFINDVGAYTTPPHPLQNFTQSGSNPVNTPSIPNYLPFEPMHTPISQTPGTNPPQFTPAFPQSPNITPSSPIESTSIVDGTTYTILPCGALLTAIVYPYIPPGQQYSQCLSLSMTITPQIDVDQLYIALRYAHPSTEFDFVELKQFLMLEHASVIIEQPDKTTRYSFAPNSIHNTSVSGMVKFVTMSKVHTEVPNANISTNQFSPFLDTFSPEFSNIIPDHYFHYDSKLNQYVSNDDSDNGTERIARIVAYPLFQGTNDENDPNFLDKFKHQFVRGVPAKITLNIALYNSSPLYTFYPQYLRLSIQRGTTLFSQKNTHLLLKYFNDNIDSSHESIPLENPSLPHISPSLPPPTDTLQTISTNFGSFLVSSPRTFITLLSPTQPSDLIPTKLIDHFNLLMHNLCKEMVSDPTGAICATKPFVIFEPTQYTQTSMLAYPYPLATDSTKVANGKQFPYCVTWDDAAAFFPSIERVTLNQDLVPFHFSSTQNVFKLTAGFMPGGVTTLPDEWLTVIQREIRHIFNFVQILTARSAPIAYYPTGLDKLSVLHRPYCDSRYSMNLSCHDVVRTRDNTFKIDSIIVRQKERIITLVYSLNKIKTLDGNLLEPMVTFDLYQGHLTENSLYDTDALRGAFLGNLFCDVITQSTFDNVIYFSRFSQVRVVPYSSIGKTTVNIKIPFTVDIDMLGNVSVLATIVSEGIIDLSQFNTLKVNSHDQGSPYYSYNSGFNIPIPIESPFISVCGFGDNDQAVNCGQNAICSDLAQRCECLPGYYIQDTQDLNYIENSLNPLICIPQVVQSCSLTCPMYMTPNFQCLQCICETMLCKSSTRQTMLYLIPTTQGGSRDSKLLDKYPESFLKTALVDYFILELDLNRHVHGHSSLNLVEHVHFATLSPFSSDYTSIIVTFTIQTFSKFETAAIDAQFVGLQNRFKDFITSTKSGIIYSDFEFLNYAEVDRAKTSGIFHPAMTIDSQLLALCLIADNTDSIASETAELMTSACPRPWVAFHPGWIKKSGCGEKYGIQGGQDVQTIQQTPNDNIFETSSDQNDPHNRTKNKNFSNSLSTNMPRSGYITNGDMSSQTLYSDIDDLNSFDIINQNTQGYYVLKPVCVDLNKRLYLPESYPWCVLGKFTLIPAVVELSICPSQSSSKLDVLNQDLGIVSDILTSGVELSDILDDNTLIPVNSSTRVNLIPLNPSKSHPLTFIPSQTYDSFTVTSMVLNRLSYRSGDYITIHWSFTGDGAVPITVLLQGIRFMDSKFIPGELLTLATAITVPAADRKISFQLPHNIYPTTTGDIALATFNQAKVVALYSSFRQAFPRNVIITASPVLTFNNVDAATNSTTTCNLEHPCPIGAVCDLMNGYCRCQNDKFNFDNRYIPNEFSSCIDSCSIDVIDCGKFGTCIRDDLSPPTVSPGKVNQRYQPGQEFGRPRCECQEGYFGNLCQFKLCPTFSLLCYQHGTIAISIHEKCPTLVADIECSCDTFWSGAFCDQCLIEPRDIGQYSEQRAPRSSFQAQKSPTASFNDLNHPNSVELSPHGVQYEETLGEFTTSPDEDRPTSKVHHLKSSVRSTANSSDQINSLVESYDSLTQQLALSRFVVQPKRCVNAFTKRTSYDGCNNCQCHFSHWGETCATRVVYVSMVFEYITPFEMVHRDPNDQNDEQYYLISDPSQIPLPMKQYYNHNSDFTSTLGMSIFSLSPRSLVFLADIITNSKTSFTCVIGFRTATYDDPLSVDRLKPVDKFYADFYQRVDEQRKQEKQRIGEVPNTEHVNVDPSRANPNVDQSFVFSFDLTHDSPSDVLGRKIMEPAQTTIFIKNLIISKLYFEREDQIQTTDVHFLWSYFVRQFESSLFYQWLKTSAITSQSTGNGSNQQTQSDKQSVVLSNAVKLHLTNVFDPICSVLEPLIAQSEGELENTNRRKVLGLKCRDTPNPFYVELGEANQSCGEDVFIVLAFSVGYFFLHFMA
jgi:hypothetical protein